MGLRRAPHTIKANKRTEMPRETIFFDCETIDEEVEEDIIQHNLKLGTACYAKWKPDGAFIKQDWLTFYHPDEFWAWALEHIHSHRRMIFIAHNLDFDFLVLQGLTFLEHYKYYCSSMISSDKIGIWQFVQYKYPPNSQKWKNYKARYKKRPRVTKTALFLDLMNYFDTSLKALGESVGCTKIKINFKTCSMVELTDYCKNDVLIMMEAWGQWISFLHAYDLGVWGRTLPSQAFNAYRHRFMPHKIRVHTNEKATALERSGYFGGRCECFQTGHFDKGPYYLLDINSMYPYVMQKEVYPVQLLTYIKQASIDDLKYHMDSYGIMAEVLIDAHKPCFPKRIDGKLCFPLGKFWTTLTTPELKLLPRGAALIAIRGLAVYKLAPIFRDYVKFFYSKRQQFKQEGHEAFNYCCKLLMNSLYGKFGQKIDNYLTIGKDPEHGLGFYGEYDVELHKWIRFRRMNGKIDIADGYEEGYNSFVAISAFVTAYARCKLGQIIKRVLDGDLYYCDTDSVIVNQRGYKSLQGRCHATNLGSLALEKVSETLTIYNAKDYVFANKRKTKGVRTTAKKIDTHTFGQWQQRSLKRVLWNNQADNCQWKWVEKVMRAEYTKGVVDPDGRVTPFYLDESVDSLPF